MYYFKRGSHFGKWEHGFVRHASEHIVHLSGSTQHRGKQIKASYEDVPIAPQSSLLFDLDKLGFLFPRSTSIVDEDSFPVDQESKIIHGSADCIDQVSPMSPPNEYASNIPVDSIFNVPRIVNEDPTEESLAPSQKNCISLPVDQEKLPTFDITQTDPSISEEPMRSAEEVADMFREEAALWSDHPVSREFFNGEKLIPENDPPMDIGTSINPP